MSPWAEAVCDDLVEGFGECVGESVRGKSRPGWEPGRRAKSFLLVSGCSTDSQVVGAGGRVVWCAEWSATPGGDDE